MQRRGFIRLLGATAAGLITAGTLSATTPAYAATQAATRAVSVQQTSLADAANSAIYMDSATMPNTVGTCGWVTCSVYLSRAQTKAINQDIVLSGGGVGGLVAACGALAAVAPPISLLVSAACTVDVSYYGWFMLNAINRAAGDNGCLRIRYVPNHIWAMAFYDDHSNYCHDT
jgi:hypothetical protein